MRRCVVIAVLALAAALAVGTVRARAAAPPDDLLARAKAARLEAEEDLAEARKRHLDERRALAAELQGAYDALDVAETAAEKARTVLADLAEQAKDLERSAALAAAQTQRQIRQAGDAVEAQVDASDPVAAVEEAVWARLQARLAGLAVRQPRPRKR